MQFQEQSGTKGSFSLPGRSMWESGWGQKGGVRKVQIITRGGSGRQWEKSEEEGQGCEVHRYEARI